MCVDGRSRSRWYSVAPESGSVLETCDGRRRKARLQRRRRWRTGIRRPHRATARRGCSARRSRVIMHGCVYPSCVTGSDTGCPGRKDSRRRCAGPRNRCAKTGSTGCGCSPCWCRIGCAATRARSWSNRGRKRCPCSAWGAVSARRAAASPPMSSWPAVFASWRRCRTQRYAERSCSGTSRSRVTARPSAIAAPVQNGRPSAARWHRSCARWVR